MNSNQMLKRLVNALENIKYNLEQKILLFNRNLDINQQFLPFDRDLNFWDEQYCHLKCLFNEFEFNEDKNGFSTSSNSLGLVESCDSNQNLVIDGNNDRVSEENSLIAIDNQCDNDSNNSCDGTARQLISTDSNCGNDFSDSLVIFDDNKDENIDGTHKSCLNKVKGMSSFNVSHLISERLENDNF